MPTQNHRFLLLSVLLSLGLSLPGRAEEAKAVQIVTSHFPPYAVESGPDAPGAVVEAAQMLARRMQVKVTNTQFLPWTRAQVVAQKQPQLLILPLDRTPERETRYRWIVKLFCRPIGFVTLHSVHATLGPMDTMRDARIGVLRTSSYASQLRALRFSNLVEIDTYADLARLMSMSSFDAIYASQDITANAMKALGLTDAEIVVAKPSGYDDSWLAASLDMSEQEAQKWRQAWSQARKDGTVEKMLDARQVRNASCAPG